MYNKGLVLILIIFLFCSKDAFAEKPQRYMPYPIIFVTGVGTEKDPNTSLKGSPSHDLPPSYLFYKLSDYFQGSNSYGQLVRDKYDAGVNTQPGAIPNLELFFYDAQQDSLSKNAGYLADKINSTITDYYPSSYDYTEPCSTPKVILVCHSYGGLIARKMLADNVGGICNSVAAVIFIGTPQDGSPLANIGYFLPKEIPMLKADIDKLDKLIAKSSNNPTAQKTYKGLKRKEYIKIQGDLELMCWAEKRQKDGGIYISTRDETDTNAVTAAIAGNSKWQGLFNELPAVSAKGALLATLIPHDDANSYSHTFKEGVIARTIPAGGPLSYSPSSEAGTYNLGTYFGTNVTTYAIVGNCNFTLKEGFIYWEAARHMGWENFCINDYSFEQNHYWDDGDGVVSLSSQKAIVPQANVYEIPAIHTPQFPTHGSGSFTWELNFSGNSTTPSISDIILKDIDDVPVIESVRLVKVFSNTYPYFYGPIYYLVVKVSDYLLADIKIDEMTVNGTSVIPPDFYDPYPPTGNKPYYELGKDFLKERDVTVTAPDIIVQNPSTGQSSPLVVSFHLLPGEFVVRADQIVQGNFYLKIENPAGKVASCALYYPNVITAYKRHGDATGNYPANPESPGPATYVDTLNLAYQNFISSPSVEYDPTVLTGEGRGPLNEIGGSIYSMASDYHDIYGDTWEVSMDMNYRSFVNFSLNVGQKTIKEVNLIGNLGKFFMPPASDFNILIYTGTQTADNNLLSTISTASFESGAPIQIPVNLVNVNGNGDNGFVFKPDFDENNCFASTDGSITPKPASAPAPNSSSFFWREAGFYDPPTLFVTFVENNP